MLKKKGWGVNFTGSVDICGKKKTNQNMNVIT